VWTPNATSDGSAALQDLALLCGQGTTPAVALYEWSVDAIPAGMGDESPSGSLCDTCEPGPKDPGATQ
jgi:hypothetical protein